MFIGEQRLKINFWVEKLIVQFLDRLFGGWKLRK
jgi:hypothetical protein